MKILPTAAFWIVVVCCCAVAIPADAASTPALVVEPARLVLDTTLNSPVVLRLEVTPVNNPPGPLDLRVEGMQIQREIHPLPNGGAIFLIEPDTSQVADVSGSIHVVDRAGAVLCSVPVAGKVRSLVRASPARVFLGGLEYGTISGDTLERRFRLTAERPWKILGIDFADIPGASSEIVADTGEDKELIVRFAVDTLKAGQPFGAFIKRDVRIRTDMGTQPEITIPIEAMLSINKTQRDFRIYVFHGNERWQGRWSTPNIAAAVIAPLGLLLLGWGAVLVRMPAGWGATGDMLLSRTQTMCWVCRLLALTLLALSGAGMVFLVKTYSRGGWTAYGAGLALMLIVMKEQRRILLAGATFFLVALLLLPAGLERAASTSSMKEDQSIGHRLLVWRGALEMIADHPWRGVGAGRFGEVFTAYYQEPWHKDVYTTAVSDYLTFAAEQGMIPVLLMIGSVVCLAMVAIGYLRRRGDTWLAPIVCALFTTAISSIFSSVEFIRDVQALASAGIGTLLIYCGVCLVLEQRSPRSSGNAVENFWVRGACVGSMVICLLGATVACAAWMRPADYRVQQNTLGADHGPARIEYFPGRTVSQQGTLLFLPASQDSLITVGRQVLRPLAENGWRTITLDLCMFDQEAAKQVVAAMHDMESTTLVLAEGARARVAVMAAQLLDSEHRPKLIFADPVFFSALRECDQSKAREITSGGAIIPSEQWQAFKQNRRNGLDSIIKACSTMVGREQVSDPNSLQSASQAWPAHATMSASAADPRVLFYDKRSWLPVMILFA